MPVVDIVLKSRDLFFVAGGTHHPGVESAEGLFAQDTRYLNRVELTIDGSDLTAGPWHSSDLDTATAILVDTGLAQDGGRQPRDLPVGVTATMSIDSKLHLSYTVHNRTRFPLELDLRFRIWTDFRDIFELRGWTPQHSGPCLPPAFDSSRCLLRYRAHDGHILTTALEFDPAPTFEPGLAWPGDDSRVLAGSPVEGGASTGAIAGYQLHLAPDSARRVHLRVWPDTKPTVLPVTGAGEDQVALRPRTKITTDNPDFNSLLTRSLDDLEALWTRFPDGETHAAGVPWFVAPFGRDSLIVGWQTLHLDPARATETLRMLAGLQGRKSDEVTGEQPGKIIHEARYGELARLEEIPHRPYYGTVDATSLFLLLVAETLAWTADPTLYTELRSEIAAAFGWVEEFGDRDGDGLVEYQLEADPGALSPLTARHQSWKDSDDSLHHPDGREPTGNIAPVEVQGYTYAAYARLAEMLSRVGDVDFAARLESGAVALKKRVNRAFWIDDEEYYAQALDGDKKQVKAISSNAGQLLFTGIVPPARARAVVDRMGKPDLDSGWGVRTLSSRMASYHPASYHNGSIWPHDNGLIADGCYRMGHADMGARLFQALFETGRASPDGRLRELYCGNGRDQEAPDAPLEYPSACSPQAWAAGVFPGLIRSALGLRVDPAAGVLDVTPALPPFLEVVEFENMEVLGSRGSLAVRRHHDHFVVESSDLPIRVRPPARA